MNPSYIIPFAFQGLVLLLAWLAAHVLLCTLRGSPALTSRHPLKPFGYMSCLMGVLLLFSSVVYAQNLEETIAVVSFDKVKSLDFKFTNHYKRDAFFVFPGCNKCKAYFVKPGQSVSDSMHQAFSPLAVYTEEGLKCQHSMPPRPYHDQQIAGLFSEELGEDGNCHLDFSAKHRAGESK